MGRFNQGTKSIKQWLKQFYWEDTSDEEHFVVAADNFSLLRLGIDKCLFLQKQLYTQTGPEFNCFCIVKNLTDWMPSVRRMNVLKTCGTLSIN